MEILFYRYGQELLNILTIFKDIESVFCRFSVYLSSDKAAL